MSAPVKITCPDIDKVIGAIEEALKACKNGRKRDISTETDDDFWNVEYALSGQVYLLEQLRSDNAQLRLWGDSLEEQIHEAAQQIASLESQLEEKVNA